MRREDERSEEVSLSGRRGRVASGNGALALSEDERRGIRARASPEGIVTILFTDVVESTRLRQRLGDDVAQELFREHNRILRDQIGKHSGFEVKTSGDGFMVAFTDVAGALNCAIAIQRAIAQHNREHPGQQLQVRIGLNCGQTIKEEEDFFGTAVVVAARIASLARGGEILVSEMVRGLAASRQGIRYVQHGRRHLKGLVGTYGIWAVPWRESEVRGIARPWSRPAFCVTALALLLVAIGGGIAGGLVLSRGGGGGGAPAATVSFQEVVTHLVTEGTTGRVSGDCLSEDLLYRGSSEGTVTGDVSGGFSATGDTTLYAADSCQSGLVKATFTITDSDGNSLSGTTEGPISLARMLQASAGSTVSAAIITGGSGIYEGVTGKGSCTTLSVHEVEPDGTVTSQAEADCAFQLAAAGAAGTGSEPVIVQMGASSEEMTVFGSPADIPNTVSIVVLYRNNRDQPQKGLSLRVPVPEGTQILAAARGEKQPISTGERAWNLPDLPPGAIQRLEFTLQLLAAETSTVPLVVQVSGEGFEQPVTSDPVMIRVKQ